MDLGARLPGARALPAILVISIALFVAMPTAFGFSGGITKDNAAVPAFEEIGCTACHGPGPSGHHDFAEGGNDFISWDFVPEGETKAVAGNVYEEDGVYRIIITLDEQTAPEQANKAGFNLRTSAGSFEAVEGSTQTSGDGMEATHVDASSTSWEVLWTAPHEGPAIFDLFVNDVDGSGAPDEGDMVYRVGWFLQGHDHALPGAAVEEHEVHVGVPLPQYWLGLIALASMVLVILFGYVYLKYASPHNTDEKDR